MRKYWVTLEDAVYDNLQRVANERGTSVGTLTKEIVLSYLKETETDNELFESNIEELIQKMKTKLEKMGADSNPFIVKDLVGGDEWDKLSRSEKMICSKSLARYINEHPDSFVFHSAKNCVNYYKCIKKRMSGDSL